MVKKGLASDPSIGLSSPSVTQVSGILTEKRYRRRRLRNGNCFTYRWSTARGAVYGTVRCRAPPSALARLAYCAKVGLKSVFSEETENDCGM